MASHGCRVSCTGLYADVGFHSNDNGKLAKDQDKFEDLQVQYNRYKENYAMNIKFDQNVDTLGTNQRN